MRAKLLAGGIAALWNLAALFAVADQPLRLQPVHGSRPDFVQNSAAAAVGGVLVGRLAVAESADPPTESAGAGEPEGARDAAAPGTVRIAAAQPKARLIDFHLAPNEALARVEQSLNDLERLVHDAGEAGCDAVALPEDTLGLGHWEAGNKEVLDAVLPQAVDRMLARLGRAAASHGMYLVCSSDTIDEEHVVRNTAFLLDREGAELGRYHKVNMPIHELDKQRGTGFPVFETPELGTVGMLICYDMVFPEAPRCLALAGADIVFHATLGGAAFGDGDISLAAFRTRAAENFMYVVVAQRGDGSMIISPRGAVLARAEGPDSLAIADLDPRGGRQGGDALNHQADMRARLFRERSPEAFGMLTSREPPVLRKAPETIGIAEAVRIGAGTLTVGEERFEAAEDLAAAGKTSQAVRAFEQLTRDFPHTWIDRVGRERLAELARLEIPQEQPSGKPSAGPAAASGPAEANGADDENPPIAIRGTLRVHPGNPRYFTDDTGKAIFLTGAHTWNNLVDMGRNDPPEAFDFEAYLDLLEQHGHNFIRLWAWDSAEWDTRANGDLGKDFVHHVAPLPWRRTGPGEARDGKPKFDLTQFDPDYFERLRDRVSAAGQRGIYVSVMLFEGWGLYHGNRGRAAAEGWAWRTHPFHPDNNINGINGDTDSDPVSGEVHRLGNQKINDIQTAYIKKVVDTVNDLDNVLYEVINEGGQKEWDWWVVETIKEYEQSKPKQHPVGITGHGAEKLESMLASPADWTSPGRIDGYAEDPPAWDGKKVSLLDTDHVWGVGGSAGWVWKSFLRGHNPIFMDPYDGKVLGTPGDPRWEPIRQALGMARRVALRVDLAALEPHDALSSTRYCLADPGRQYLVYLPDGGEAMVDLAAAKGTLKVEWINPRSGESSDGGQVEGGQARALLAAFDGDALVYLRAETK